MASRAAMAMDGLADDGENRRDPTDWGDNEAGLSATKKKSRSKRIILRFFDPPRKSSIPLIRAGNRGDPRWGSATLLIFMVCECFEEQKWNFWGGSLHPRFAILVTNHGCISRDFGRRWESEKLGRPAPGLPCSGCGLGNSAEGRGFKLV